LMLALLGGFVSFTVSLFIVKKLYTNMNWFFAFYHWLSLIINGVNSIYIHFKPTQLERYLLFEFIVMHHRDLYR
jgi:hypothetical protein